MSLSTADFQALLHPGSATHMTRLLEKIAQWPGEEYLVSELQMAALVRHLRQDRRYEFPVYEDTPGIKHLYMHTQFGTVKIVTELSW